jgi:two-component system, OmpR family, phosphate regulon sensor histidine kinase PhoR
MPTADADLLEQLIERSPNGILVTDGSGHLRMVNKTARSILPMLPKPEGRRLAEAIPIPALVDLLSSQPTGAVERSFSHGSRDLFLRTVPLDPSGRLFIIEDVTFLRKAERYRREFVANVSHELRTPATSIAGYAEMLLDDKEKLDEETAMMVGVIHRNALRLNSLFEDLLTLSRIDAQSESMPRQSLALLPIVQEAIDKQRSRAEGKGIKFQVMVSDSLDVYASRDAMIHIVGNLVENAVKYNRDDGLVTVRSSFREGEGKVLLEVIDLGLGIAPAHQERIFERFFRVDKARSSAVGGTGLGLAIVKQLVDRMDAKIELRSRVGSGSIFRVWLDPRQPPALDSDGEG